MNIWRTQKWSLGNKMLLLIGDNRSVQCSLTTGRWRHRRRQCSPSCLPLASEQTCPGWCWRESRHQAVNTGAELSGRWSISSAAPAHLLYRPENSSYPSNCCLSKEVWLSEDALFSNAKTLRSFRGQSGCSGGEEDKRPLRIQDWMYEYKNHLWTGDQISQITGVEIPAVTKFQINK